VKRLSNKEISGIVGLCQSHVSTIWRKYERGGLDAIKPGLRGRRHGAQREPTAEQEVGIQKLRVDKTPDQLKLTLHCGPGMNELFCCVDQSIFNMNGTISTCCKVSVMSNHNNS